MDEAAEPARKRRRKDADTLATELLASGKLLSDADVLSVLSRWAFQKNRNRQNVIPDGSEFVYSDTLGLTKDRRGTIAVEAYTRDRPSVFKFLCEWLKQGRPTELALDFPFTSISLNYNYAARLHRDGNNAGPSLARSFGAFIGGELSYWSNDDKRTPLEQLRDKDAVRIDTHTCTMHCSTAVVGTGWNYLAQETGTAWCFSHSTHGIEARRTRCRREAFIRRLNR